MADLLPILKSLTVAELQAELKKRGLKKSGNKAALVERLTEFLVAQEENNEKSAEENDERSMEQSVESAVDKEDPGDARDLSEKLTGPIHQEEEEEKYENERVFDNGEANVRIIDTCEESQPSGINSEIDEQNSHQMNETNENPVSSTIEKEDISEEETSNVEIAVGDIDNSEVEKPITSILHEDDALDYEEEEMEEKTNEEKEEEPAVKDKEIEKDVDEKNAIEDVEGDDEEGEIKDDSKPENDNIEKPQPKPVMLKKNTVSLAGRKESAEEKAARRKRRWGSTAAKNTTVAVDSDSLKKLIPALTVDAIDVADKLDYDEDNGGDDEMMDRTPDSVGDGNKKGRTVKLDSAKKVVLTNKPSEPVVIDVDKDSAALTAKKPRVSISLDEPDDFDMKNERERSPSPPKNKPSVYLCIKNLVRPFTIGQLKSLIGKTGDLAEEGFWINSIKSISFVKFVNKEGAEATREALHGLRWPSGNPKVLNVDFALEDKIFSQTDGKLGEKVVVEIIDEDEAVEPKKKRDRKRSQNGENRKEKVEDETPVKHLDDLFRKTKATPCIYWMPLTDEEIAKRQAKANLSSDKKENRRSPDKRQSPERKHRSPARRNRSPARRNRSPVRRSRSPDRRTDNRRTRGWR